MRAQARLTSPCLVHSRGLGTSSCSWVVSEVPLPSSRPDPAVHLEPRCASSKTSKLQKPYILMPLSLPSFRQPGSWQDLVSQTLLNQKTKLEHVTRVCLELVWSWDEEGSSCGECMCAHNGPISFFVGPDCDVCRRYKNLKVANVQCAAQYASRLPAKF